MLCALCGLIKILFGCGYAALGLMNYPNPAIKISIKLSYLPLPCESSEGTQYNSPVRKAGEKERNKISSEGA